MRLREIADQIDRANETVPWPFDGKDFLATLTVVRSTEGELIGPIGPDLDVPFPFFLVDHISHVPESIVLACTDLPHLEQQILSPSGFTNNFTTHCFAFVRGVLRKYRVLYRDQTQAEVVFAKARQLAADNYADVYRNRRLEWL